MSLARTSENDNSPATIVVPGTLAFGPNGHLYLADLGFFSWWRLCRLAKPAEGGKRFFVMRLQYGTGLYTRSGHQIELRGILPQQEGEAREIGALVGKQARRRYG